jgi:hypothetical protein
LEVFKIFDKNSDGLVSGEDLKEGMSRFSEWLAIPSVDNLNIYLNSISGLVSLDEKFTEHEISEMVREADVDGDGLINYEEFVKMMVRIISPPLLLPEHNIWRAIPALSQYRDVGCPRECVQLTISRHIVDPSKSQGPRLICLATRYYKQEKKYIIQAI